MEALREGGREKRVLEIGLARRGGGERRSRGTKGGQGRGDSGREGRRGRQRETEGAREGVRDGAREGETKREREKGIWVRRKEAGERERRGGSGKGRASKGRERSKECLSLELSQARAPFCREHSDQMALLRAYEGWTERKREGGGGSARRFAEVSNSPPLASSAPHPTLCHL